MGSRAGVGLGVGFELHEGARRVARSARHGEGVEGEAVAHGEA